jgi:AGZA family xanthine/uracil permease-like MFS transporter
LPEAAVAPILIFIGLEITVQAFVASPARHAPAVALSFIPAVAALVLIQVNTLLASVGKGAADLSGDGRLAYGHLLVLGNGFIVTALLWGWALVGIVEGRLRRAAAVFLVAGTATLFGVIHSPRASGALFWPWSAGNAPSLLLAAGYGMGALILVLLSASAGRTQARPPAG